MRALKPVPVTSERSTPSSRAKRRTDGPAWAFEKPASLMGARSVRPPGIAVAGGLAPLPEPFVAAGAAVFAADVALGALLVAAGAAGGAVAGAAAGFAGAAAGAEPAAAAASPSTRTVATTSPGFTLPPLVTCS